VKEVSSLGVDCNFFFFFFFFCGICWPTAPKQNFSTFKNSKLLTKPHKNGIFDFVFEKMMKAEQTQETTELLHCLIQL